MSGYTYGLQEITLGYLRWHWPCYVITYRMSTWRAERRDTHEVLTSDTPDALLDLIRIDYEHRPIPR